MIERKDWPKGVTPKGVFKYPRLNEPDTKFKKEGEYSVKLVLSDDNGAADLRTLIDTFHAEAYAEECNDKKKKKLKQADLPYKQATDDEGDEIPGVWEFNFKRKASGKKKDGSIWRAKPDLFDASGQRIQDEIWGGTKGRVAFSIKPWYAASLGFGLSLLLNAVKVLDLVTRGERTADAYGFGEDEEGYRSSGATDDDTESEENEDGDEEGEEEDDF